MAEVEWSTDWLIVRRVSTVAMVGDIDPLGFEAVVCSKACAVALLENNE